ncbi:MAG: hypothetical protein ABSB94_07690 [Syntrophorhabdales bacterium]|jgi:predicted  nucleic acid-binding Zn-ribbon protein
MRLNTASEAISFLRELETKAATFYESMGKAHSSEEALFSDFAKESKKNIANIERTYFGVITDALEGCFAFDIDRSKYEIHDMAATARYADDLAAALEMEERIRRFYVDAAAQSKGLMADVPRVMERIARARGERQERLRSLMDALKKART